MAIVLVFIVLAPVQSQEAWFFRVSGPVASGITAHTRDGLVTWTNVLTNATFVLQTAQSLPHQTNWIDYLEVQVLATNQITTRRVYCSPPPFGPSSKRTPILFDQDYNSDCGDVGAHIAALALERLGYVKILGMGISVSDSAMPARAMRAVNISYGRSEIPIGTNSNAVSNGFATGMADVMATNFSSSATGTSCVPVVQLYRQQLAAANDRSVHIVFAGQLRNLLSLWTSAADEYSTLNGAELVKLKCAEIDIMGGDYPLGYEYNFYTDSEGAMVLNSITNIPVHYFGFTDGTKLWTGTFFKSLSSASPVRRAYEYVLANTVFRDPALGREWWDEMPLAWLAFGTNYFTLSAPGYNTVSVGGSNYWTSAIYAQQRYATLTTDASKLAELLENMNTLASVPPSIAGVATPPLAPSRATFRQP